MNNYPDDIRSFDNCPNSPFFVDPNEWMDDVKTEMAENWLDELNLTGKIDYEDWDKADLAVLMTDDGRDPDDPRAQVHFLEAHVLKIIEADPERYNPEPSFEDLAWG